MDAFVQSLQAVGVPFAIGMLGFWLMSRHDVPTDVLMILSALSLEIALPCLVFSQMLLQFDPVTMPNWWMLPIAWAVFTLGLGAFTLAAMRLSRKGTRREFAATLFYQNATFVPLIVVAELYGRDSTVLLYLLIFTMFYAAMLFGTFQWFFGMGQEKPRLARLLHPVLIATALAIGIRLAGGHVLFPRFAVSAMEMVGSMAVPLLMLVVGGSVYVDWRQQSGLQMREVAKFVLIKNLVLPGLALGILAILRPERELALIILLQSAVPPVTAVPVLVQRAGGNSSIASQFLVGSFLFSLVSLPLMLALFARLSAG